MPLLLPLVLQAERVESAMAIRIASHRGDIGFIAPPRKENIEKAGSTRRSEVFHTAVFVLVC
jgi:hypothetical protein